MKRLFMSLLVIFTYASHSQGNRIWATYYGGPANEVNPVGGPVVATDTLGNVLLAGYTLSSANIASGGFQNTFGGSVDAFLVKFDANGNRLWATYYGGQGAEYVYGLTTDNSGNIYLVGKSSGTAGISSGGFQNNFGGGTFDAFIVKFDQGGNRLWASYYGGGADDSGNGVSVDASGNIYMSGTTSSTTNISSGGHQNSFAGTSDAYLVKFSSAGNRLWATYYGGPGSEVCNGCVNDGAGNIYITGGTGSSVGIASGGFQNTYGGLQDAFLAKFDATGTHLWSTYYGGNNGELAYSAITSASGNVYMAGFTKSTSGIAANGFQNTFGGGIYQGDAFVVQFNSNGNRIWGSYYGGPSEDYCLSITKDRIGNIYLGGDTYSSAGIAFNGFQNNLAGTENEFIAKVDSNGNRLCSTYFGVNHDEDGHVAADLNGNVYLAGGTTSTLGIAFGGFQNIFGGGGMDAYLAKFSASCPCTAPSISVTTTKTMLCAGQVATLSALGALSFTWSNGMTAPSITVSPGSTTVYSVTGLSEPSCSSTAVFTQSVSVCEHLFATELNDFQVDIFPLPSMEEINITCDDGIDLVEVLDQLGRLVYRSMPKSSAHSLKLQAAGVYYVRVQISNYVLTKKVILLLHD